MDSDTFKANIFKPTLPSYVSVRGVLILFQNMVSF